MPGRCARLCGSALLEHGAKGEFTLRCADGTAWLVCPHERGHGVPREWVQVPQASLAKPPCACALLVRVLCACARLVRFLCAFCARALSLHAERGLSARVGCAADPAGGDLSGARAAGAGRAE